MASDALRGMRIAILVTDYFEQVELTDPRSALANAGAKTSIISSKRGEVQGVNHIDKADTFPVDLTFDLANADDFDAVHIPGGVFNADPLRMIPEAQAFVRRMQEARKPISVICHGPWLLVSAGLVKGRTLTSWPTLQDDIRNAGGTWVDREVVRDGNWVSSRKPADIPTFNREMIALYAESRPAVVRPRVGTS
jgi:protease I